MNERWRDDERQRWDPDRDRYRREGSGRQDYGNPDYGRQGYGSHRETAHGPSPPPSRIREAKF